MSVMGRTKFSILWAHGKAIAEAVWQLFTSWLPHRVRLAISCTKGVPWFSNRRRCK